MKKKPCHVVYSSLDILDLEAENDKDARKQAVRMLEQLGKPGWKITGMIDLTTGKKYWDEWIAAKEKRRKKERKAEPHPQAFVIARKSGQKGGERCKHETANRSNKAAVTTALLTGKRKRPNGYL